MDALQESFILFQQMLKIGIIGMVRNGQLLMELQVKHRHSLVFLINFRRFLLQEHFIFVLFYSQPALQLVN